MRKRRFPQVDVAGWPREKFVAVLLTILLLCAWMVSSAAGTYAQNRQRSFLERAKWAAASPLPHLAVVGAARGLVGDGDRALVLLRADSVPAGEARRLCALAAAEPPLPAGVAVVWLGLGGEVASCVSRSAAPRLLTPGPDVTDSLRAQLAETRWVLLDRDARALYSRRGVPSPTDLGSVVGLLAPAAEVAP